jgi:hypothetical protein
VISVLKTEKRLLLLPDEKKSAVLSVKKDMDEVAGRGYREANDGKRGERVTSRGC